jgi:CO/xanthine dehydrogenase FAD-binding subunit
MRPFAYERPARLDDAVALLAEHGSDARLLAGGTDLIIRLRDGTVRPGVVVDVKRIAELDGDILVEGGHIRIGAHTTMTAIAADDRIRRDFTALAEGAAVVGSVQIRNRATLAGNICNASPAADTAPALLVFGALVVVAGPAGVRRIPHDPGARRARDRHRAAAARRAGRLRPRPADPPPRARPRLRHAGLRGHR